MKIAVIAYYKNITIEKSNCVKPLVMALTTSKGPLAVPQMGNFNFAIKQHWWPKENSSSSSFSHLRRSRKSDCVIWNNEPYFKIKLVYEIEILQLSQSILQLQFVPKNMPKNIWYLKICLIWLVVLFTSSNLQIHFIIIWLSYFALGWIFIVYLSWSDSCINPTWRLFWRNGMCGVEG